MLKDLELQRRDEDHSCEANEAKHLKALNIPHCEVDIKPKTTNSGCCAVKAREPMVQVLERWG